MPLLDFRNTNSLWASVLVETLVRLGLQTAVVSPGSRSTPLTMALASHPKVDAVADPGRTFRRILWPGGS